MCLVSQIGIGMGDGLHGPGKAVNGTRRHAADDGVDAGHRSASRNRFGQSGDGNREISHALQGDGEATGSGIEISLELEFTTELKKQANLTGPRVETAESIISIGSQPEFVSSLDRSIQMATSDMVHWLIDDYKLEPWAAHMLIGYSGKYDVVTVAGSMALRIPKKYLPKKS